MTDSPSDVLRVGLPPEEFVRELVVARRTAASDGVVELHLESPDGGPLPEWQPGAHVDLLLPSGTVRQYSLAGDPADRSRYRLGVLLAPDSRGGSIEVHEKLLAGSPVTIRGPRNNFELRPAEKYVFIAGGVGITPVLPMVAAAAAAGADWRLYYGGRAPETMAFTSELEAYGDRVEFYPENTRGFIPFAQVLDDPTALVYCCGPEPLLLAVESAIREWPVGQLRVERFAPKEIEHDPDHPFDVELARSDLTLTVPSDKSIAQVARDAGVLVFTSCEEGMCGTCETQVLVGTPEHRDSVMSAEEHDFESTMAICVSRSRTPRLVLDL